MFNGQRALVASFFIIMAIQTWRFIKNPPPSVPLKGWPPPFIYTGTIIVFSMLALLGDMWDRRVAGALGIGLMLGVAFAEAQQKKQKPGPPPTPL